MLTGELQLPPVQSRRPSTWLQVGALLLPIVKCAFCPVCLGLFGTAVAGARLGFLADERWHGALIGLAILVDGAILGAARRHHRRSGPLALCALAALVVIAGHLSGLDGVETSGYGGLMVAALWNVLLLSRHRHLEDGCCSGAVRPLREGGLR